MSTRNVTLVRITDQQDLDDVLARVRDRHGGEMLIEIPEHVDLFSNAVEFRALSDAAREAGVRVRVETSEPVRLELARIYGLAGNDAGSRDRQRHRHTSAGDPTRRSLATTPTRPNLDRSWHTTEEIDETTDGPAIDTPASDPEDGSFSFVISPPVPRRPDLAEPTIRDAPDARPVRRRRSRAASLIVIGLVVVVLGVVSLLIGIVAPWLRVTATPTTAPLSVDVSYGVSGATYGLDVTIEPRTITRTLDAEVTVPTTGVRVEPDGTAGGTVLLTNASQSERTVPEGTYFPGPGEVGFVTVEEVVVPAADPFGTLTFGSAIVTVAADTPGSVGNVGEGEIAGQLDDDLFFTNRSATSGGTVREIPVVDQSDIAAAQEATEAELNTEVADALSQELEPGEELLADTVSIGEVQHEQSQSAGDEAAEITVRSQLEISAQAYDPAELHEAGERALQERIGTGVPSGYALSADSLELGEPERVSGAQGPAFRVQATGSLVKVIEESEIQAIQDRLVGADQAEVDTMLSAWDGVRDVRVERGPSWLPWDAPVRLASRVEIEIEQFETESP